MQQEQQHATFGQQINAGVGLAHFFCWPIYPWLRRPGTWGSHFPGLPAVIGTLIVMPLTIGSIDGGGGAMGFMMISTCFLLVVHRIAGAFRSNKEHSLYSGKPWIRGDEMKVKKTKEPLLLLILAPMVAPISPGLSVYLGIAALCHCITVSYGEASRRAKVRVMEDARIEQLGVMRQYRETYGE